MLHFGIVEDNLDPRELGRVRVRVYGIHSPDKAMIPTAGLPWASVVQPTTSAANSGIGETPRLLPGSLVMVMFTDPEEMQFPIVMGSLPSELSEVFLKIDGQTLKRGTSTVGFQDPGKQYPKLTYVGENDLPKLARNETPILAGDSEFVRESESFKNSLFLFTEPSDIRNEHEYPYNQVKQSQSGHYEEWDDTPGNERINKQHKSGTFEEWRPDGTSVEKIFKDRYTLILDDDNIYIGGAVNVHINGACNLYVQKDYNIHVAGNMNVQVDGNKQEIVQGNSTSQVFGSVSKLTKGSVVEGVSGSTTIYSAGGTSIDGGEIHLNSGKSSSVPASLTPLVSKEYDLEFVGPLLEEAGRYAAHDDVESISSTPASYPADKERPSTAVTTATVGSNTAKTQTVSKEGITDKVDYKMQLTENFTLGSLSKNALFSHQIVAQGGRSTSQIIYNLKQLAVNVVEPLAAQYAGMRINSGFRKGTGKSQHERGMALDVQWPGIAIKEYLVRAKWIAENLPFDQLILEHGNTIWLHCSYNGEGAQKKQLLTMYKGKYMPGLKLYY